MEYLGSHLSESFPHSDHFRVCVRVFFLATSTQAVARVFFSPGCTWHDLSESILTDYLGSHLSESFPHSAHFRVCVRVFFLATSTQAVARVFFVLAALGMSCQSLFFLIITSAMFCQIFFFFNSPIKHYIHLLLIDSN